MIIPTDWRDAGEAARNMSPEWRKRLAYEVQRASGAAFVTVSTSAPGLWCNSVFDSWPASFDSFMSEVVDKHLPRLDQEGENWRVTLERGGPIFAPFESATTRSVVDEMRNKLLAPRGVRGYVVAFIVNKQEELLGSIAMGSSTLQCEQFLEQVRDPMQRVVDAAAASLQGVLKLASECGAIVKTVPHAIGLTLREQQVLALLTEGFSELNISSQLGITENTVGTHVRHIYRKLGVHSRAELATRVLTEEN